MRAVSGKVTRGLQVGSLVDTCDNSGAKQIRIISVKGHKTTRKRPAAAGVGYFVVAAVTKGKLEMRHQVVYAVIVRQRRPYRRPNGMMMKFEDNSAVVLKDEKGALKGTILKGPIAKEAIERWPEIAKIASIVV